MSTVYKSPGVYREEIFLQPQVPLPTGIPAFVGFADAIAPLPLTALLTELSLPPFVTYDGGKQRLVCPGVITEAQRLELLNLSSDRAFQQAVEALYQSAQPVVNLRRLQEFINQLLGLPNGYLAAAVQGFFENGGTRCYVMRMLSANDRAERAIALQRPNLLAALKVLEPIADLDLVAIPDAMRLMPDIQAVIQAQQAVLDHCAQTGNRLAILDAIPTENLEVIKQQRNQLLISQREPINGALYYPWLKNAQEQIVPPCGHVAGIFARSDLSRGVFKAPANELLTDVLDLALPAAPPLDATAIAIDNRIQDELNPEGINCLRAFPGRGIRVWGARTLSRDPTWLYINVRRIVLTLGRWIDRNMLWATFEPNSPRLWIRIQRELTTYLESLWRQGALQGATADQAFLIKCDAETNFPESRDNGQVVTEIGLAIAAPAEFIIVRIVHR